MIGGKLQKTMVGVRGFEPPTSSSRTKRASHCATPRCFWLLAFGPPANRSHQARWDIRDRVSMSQELLYRNGIKLSRQSPEPAYNRLGSY